MKQRTFVIPASADRIFVLYDVAPDDPAVTVLVDASEDAPAATPRAARGIVAFLEALKTVYWTVDHLRNIPIFQ
jgi:nitric oxide reductase activation protein